MLNDFTQFEKYSFYFIFFTVVDFQSVTDKSSTLKWLKLVLNLSSHIIISITMLLCCARTKIDHYQKLLAHPDTNSHVEFFDLRSSFVSVFSHADSLSELN